MKILNTITLLLFCLLTITNTAIAQQTATECFVSNSSADCDGRACLDSGERVAVADCGVFHFCDNSPDEWWCSAFCDVDYLIIGACAEATEVEPVNPNTCEPECRNGASCRRGTCVNQVGIVVNTCADGFVRIGADLTCVVEPEGFCQNATDCGPGHFCENNVCTAIEVDVPTPTCLGYQTCQNGYICQANGVALCR